VKKNRALENSYLSTFCMELHILIQSGITFGDGILMIQDDEPDKEGKALLQLLVNSLDEGLPLSMALKAAAVFPSYMVSMVEIGEKTGRLAETLKALSEYYDKQGRLRETIKNATLYPAILLILMVAVVLILIVKVLPIFNSVFSQLGTQMSPFAARLMRFGGWLEGASLVIAAVVCGIVAVAVAAWLIPAVRIGAANMFKNIFGGRGVFGQIASSHFASGIALAIASGLDSEKAVEMASALSGGAKSVDEKHKKCLDMLASGTTLSEAMRDSGILSARDSRMLSLGGRSGTTDTVIEDIARRAERNVEDSIDRIVSKIEPMLVIITSVIVGVILFSVMLPLVGIMTTIG